MEITQYFIGILAHHEFLLPFLGSALGGEAVVLAIAFLAAQGFIHLWAVVLFGFIGSMISDTFLFLLARSNFFRKTKAYKKMLAVYNSKKGQLSKLSHGRYFYILLITKFLYGTRTITTIYLSLKPIRFMKYTFMNAIITLIWFGVMIPIGWFAGKGFSSVLRGFKKFELILTITVLIAVIFYFIYNKLNARLLKKLEEKHQL